MAKILLKNGYVEHPEKYFSFIKTVKVDEEEYIVDVDILAGMYGGTSLKKRSQHVQGVKDLKATGGNFAFEFPSQQVKIEAERVDGAIDSLAEEFKNVSDKPIIREMKQKLQEKFASEKHSGPKDVTDFMDLVDDDEIEMVKRDAFEQVNALLCKI